MLQKKTGATCKDILRSAVHWIKKMCAWRFVFLFAPERNSSTSTQAEASFYIPLDGIHNHYFICTCFSHLFLLPSFVHLIHSTIFFFFISNANLIHIRFFSPNHNELFIFLFFQALIQFICIKRNNVSFPCLNAEMCVFTIQNYSVECVTCCWMCELKKSPVDVC